jgi:hypothetical protein
MRSTLSAALAAITAGAFAVASSASAQTDTAARVGMHLMPGHWAIDGSIGFAVPVGTFGDGLNTGLDLMGAVEYHPRGTGAFYFRGEIGYSNFGLNGGGGSASVVRFDADGLYDFPLQNTPLTIYALAGLGIYHVSAGADVCGFDAAGNPLPCSDASTGIGINFGAGVRYPINPVQVFFELRYHLPLTAPGDLSEAPYFPFQFGVRYLLP